MEQNLLCPHSQLPCANKELMNRMVQSVNEGQFAVELVEAPAHIPPEVDASSKEGVIAERDVIQAAVEKDLEAGCNGSICGPLAQLASRYVLGGPSLGEMLGNQ